MTNPDEQQLAAELARGAVSQAAPQELPLFRATSDAYFKDPAKILRGQAAKPGMLGFGAGDVVQLVTPIALALATEVAKFLADELRKNLKDEGAATIKAAISGLAARIRAAASPPGGPAAAAHGAPAGTAAVAAAAVPAAAFSQQQLSEVRRRAAEKALELNVPSAQAEVLADALVGRLAVAL